MQAETARADFKYLKEVIELADPWILTYEGPKNYCISSVDVLLLFQSLKI